MGKIGRNGEKSKVRVIIGEDSDKYQIVQAVISKMKRIVIRTIKIIMTTSDYL